MSHTDVGQTIHWCNKPCFKAQVITLKKYVKVVLELLPPNFYWDLFVHLGQLWKPSMTPTPLICCLMKFWMNMHL